MKNILKSIFTCFLFVLPFNKGFCQAGSIRIGETCPDVALSQIINFKTDHARIADFKGKLLILDFWATWCAPCVSMIPSSDSLQKKFGSKIQILPVTDQESSTVTQFLKNMYQFNHIILPSVTNDRILRSLFPHTEIPHYVWINQNSVVVAITGAEQLTEGNIQDVLDGKHVEFPVKQDIVKTIDESKPMFTVGIELIEGNKTRFEKIEDTSLLYHSVLTKYIDGFGCEAGTGINKIECKNNSIGGLYRIAAGHYTLNKLNMNSTIWEVTNSAIKNFTDSVALQMEEPGQALAWLKNYSFCYELKFPSALNEKKFDIMLSDLNNYFGAIYNIEGSLERRKAKCLALVQTGKAGFISKGTDESNVFNGYHLKLTNRPMYALINFMGINLGSFPLLVDETGYTGKIDIDLNCNLSDLGSVNEALAKYGLHLQEKEREMDMIVIKDRQQSK